ncbi:MAG: flagellar biosynthesis protein FliQ [Pirellulales bacterium]
MSIDQAIDIGREAVMMTLLISAPALIAATVMGLVIGLIQALTQVQDQTVSFVPKLVAMLIVVSLTLPWLITRMTDYSQNLLINIPQTLVPDLF